MTDRRMLIRFMGVPLHELFAVFIRLLLACLPSLYFVLQRLFLNGTARRRTR